MTGTFRKAATALALVASASMAATPALARDRGWGWGGGWGRHHDRVDAGDVLTGILIIGGIAAIASAASSGSKAQRDRDARNREYRNDQWRNDNAQRNNDYARDNRPTWNESRGIDTAVNRCVDEMERGNQQVGTVDNVGRDGDGWRVNGRMASGSDFSCSVDRDGRIRSATAGGSAY